MPERRDPVYLSVHGPVSYTHLSLFVCIPGETFDGHDFAVKAIEAGAAALLVSRNPFDAVPPVPLILVEDTVKALGKLAHCWRERLGETRVIGLTGTAGKTTVKELLAQVLSRRGLTAKTHMNLNNQIGLPPVSYTHLQWFKSGTTNAGTGRALGGEGFGPHVMRSLAFGAGIMGMYPLSLLESRVAAQGMELCLSLIHIFSPDRIYSDSGVPILPPVNTVIPGSFNRAAHKLVVVVLPLVPVTPSTGSPESWRHASSVSAMISGGVPSGRNLLMTAAATPGLGTRCV